jgi:hypothetical protein
MQSIDEARGFQDSGIENNFSSYERSMKQITLVFRHLGKAWKVRVRHRHGYMVHSSSCDQSMITFLLLAFTITNDFVQSTWKVVGRCSVADYQGTGGFDRYL